MEKQNSLEHYERALTFQATKIASQREELRKMNVVYNQSVQSAKISEAFAFLVKVIINKIKK